MIRGNAVRPWSPAGCRSSADGGKVGGEEVAGVVGVVVVSRDKRVEALRLVLGVTMMAQQRAKSCPSSWCHGGGSCMRCWGERSA